MLNSDQKRAFLAVLLSGIVLFGWQYFFTSNQPAPVVPTSKTSEALPSSSTVTPTTTPSTLGAATPTVAESVTTLTSHTLTNGQYSYQFNSDLSVVNLVNPNSVFNLSVTFLIFAPFLPTINPGLEV